MTIATHDLVKVATRFTMDLRVLTKKMNALKQIGATIFNRCTHDVHFQWVMDPSWKGLLVSLTMIVWTANILTTTCDQITIMSIEGSLLVTIICFQYRGYNYTLNCPAFCSVQHLQLVSIPVYIPRCMAWEKNSVMVNHPAVCCSPLWWLFHYSINTKQKSELRTRFKWWVILYWTLDIGLIYTHPCYCSLADIYIFADIHILFLGKCLVRGTKP